MNEIPMIRLQVVALCILFIFLIGAWFLDIFSMKRLKLRKNRGAKE